MVDVQQAKDYPIVLGDSLKDSAPTTSQLLQLRYNWVPEESFAGSSGILKPTSDGFSLITDIDGYEYDYAGWSSHNPINSQLEDLALIYEPTHKRFRLEKLSASVDLNLRSASNAFASEVKRYKQIPRLQSPAEIADKHEAEDEGSPDASNPFDYRHFLAEASEAADKSHGTGGNGSHTPLSGLQSPLLSGTQFSSSTTPQFKPTEPIPSRRKQTTSKRKPPPSKAKAAPQRAAASTARPKILSNEKISDSDEDLALVDTTPQKPTQPKRQSKQPAHASPQIKVHSASSSSAGSPVHHPQHSDSDSDTPAPKPPKADASDGALEIDDGSPPPTAARRRKINVDAFRTGAPAASGRKRMHDVENDSDAEMPDAERASDIDIDIDDDPAWGAYEDEDGDHDVEPLVLEDEPRTRGRGREERDGAREKERYRPRSPSPVPLQTKKAASVVQDDEFAAELEAALEAEDDEDGDEVGGVGVGLGIRDGDESEISEEE